MGRIPLIEDMLNFQKALRNVLTGNELFSVTTIDFSYRLCIPEGITKAS